MFDEIETERELHTYCMECGNWFNPNDGHDCYERVEEGEDRG